MYVVCLYNVYSLFIMLLRLHVLFVNSVVAMASGSDLNSMSFVGLMGMWDPPRRGVEEAIEELKSGGVDVKMITGDAKETGEAIGEHVVHVFTPVVVEYLKK